MLVRTSSSVVVLALAVAAVAVAQPPSVPAPRAAYSRAGARLTAPSSAAPLEILGAYLRSHGHSEQTVRSTAVLSEARDEATGITHLRLEQRSGTLAVYGVYVKAAVSPRGELISVIENLVAIRAASAVQPQIEAPGALRAALRHLYGDAVVPPGLARREGDTDVFIRTPFFHKEPRVTPVAIPRGDGLLGVAFLVETWSQQRNLLHHTLVGGGSEVLGVETRTANDQYKIFVKDPLATPNQTPVAGGANWLNAGSHTSTNIAGNNAHAYLDADANNAPDSGGTTISDGNFEATAELETAPSTATNRAVSVQNLFYLNNLIHDTLLAAGFTEAEGNFQETNSTGQGAASDSVNAEAQDGSGTDNANFATPVDGSNPRMQMYLWSGFGTHQVVVNTTTYLGQGSSFGPALTPTGLSGPLVLAGGTNNQACSKLPRNSLSNRVAVVDRGNCDFILKVKNIQAAGGRAVIVVNNLAGQPFTMGGSGTTTIPAVMVGLSDGNAIKGLVPATATARLTNPAPLMHDSALDSDIVWHEYGHGLTWRMIGGMSGAMAGAIGEGMGDVLAADESVRTGQVVTL